MPQFYMFKCSTCNTRIRGPKVQLDKPNTSKTGSLFVGTNRPPGVACSNLGHTGVTYTGKEDLRRADALWIKHYPKMKVKLMDQLKPNEVDGAVDVTLALQTST